MDGLIVESNGESVVPEKLIFDTDPRIDDTVEILMAFQSPELDVIGLTTTFGNAIVEKCYT